MEEDRTVELASALALLLAFIVAGVSAFIGAGGMSVFVSVLGIVGFLSEMSFGERQFGFTPPGINGVKLDAFHDLLQLSWVVVGDGKLYLTVFMFAAAFTVGLCVYLFRSSKTFRELATHRVAPIVAAALTLAAISLIVDFGLGRAIIQSIGGDPAVTFVANSKFEEASEFIGSLFLLLAAILLLAGPKNEVSRP